MNSLPGMLTLVMLPIILGIELARMQVAAKAKKKSSEEGGTES